MGRGLTALIDGDIVVYQCAAACQKAFEWEEAVVTEYADVDEVCDLMNTRIAQVKEATNATDVIVCLSDTRNFRHDVYPPYKGNRAGVKKPLAWARAREHVLNHYEAFLRPGLEADDIMGILHTTKVKVVPGRSIICSIDKDMLTVPGFHYNWSHPDDGVVEQTLRDADLFFYTQVLTGDATDGYPGCKGVGPVAAGRVLAEVTSPWEAWEEIVHQYARRLLGAESPVGEAQLHAIQQARCARILRAEDYVFETREPVMWLPPTEDVPW